MNANYVVASRQVSTQSLGGEMAHRRQNRWEMARTKEVFQFKIGEFDCVPLYVGYYLEGRQV
jgi:hypothetical protein